MSEETKEKLLTYPKEILAEYIYQKSFFEIDLFKKLDFIKKNIEFNKLIKRNDEIINEMFEALEQKDHSKWMKLNSESDEVFKKIEKLNSKEE